MSGGISPNEFKSLCKLKSEFTEHQSDSMSIELRNVWAFRLAVAVILLLRLFPVYAQVCRLDLFDQLNSLAMDIFFTSNQCRTVVDPRLARQYLRTRSSILRARCDQEIRCAMFIEENAKAVILKRCFRAISRNNIKGKIRNSSTRQNCYTCSLRPVIDLGGNTCTANSIFGWGVVKLSGSSER